jgi:hypothetical protein
VAATCAYVACDGCGPVGAGPLVAAVAVIVAALWRALISVRIALMSWAYCYWVPWVQVGSAAARRVVIAVVRKESMVVRSSSASRDRSCSTCCVCSAASIVYRTRS